MTITRYILSWLNFDLIDRLPTEVGCGNCQQTQINSYTKNLAQLNSLRLRPCSHVSGYFRKRRLFSPFSKKHRVHTKRIWLVFARRIHMKRKREVGVFKNLHSGDRFLKPAFLEPENAVYMWTEVYNQEKHLRFQNIPDTYGRGLSSWSQDL